MIKPRLYDSHGTYLSELPQWLEKAAEICTRVPVGCTFIPHDPIKMAKRKPEPVDTPEPVNTIHIRLHRIRPAMFGFALCSPLDDALYAAWFEKQPEKAKRA